MSSKKRDRLEVIYDILNTIKRNDNSVRPTRLLHESNVSPQMFTEYRKELCKKKLIFDFKDVKNKACLSLTEKGFKYLEDYKTIIQFIESFGL